MKKLLSVLAIVALVCIAVSVVANFAKAELWNVYSGKASYFFEHGEPKKSIYYWRLAVKLIPSDAYGHYMMGRAYESDEDTSDALKEYEKAVQISPEGYYSGNARRAINRISSNERQRSNSSPT